MLLLNGKNVLSKILDIYGYSDGNDFNESFEN